MVQSRIASKGWSEIIAQPLLELNVQQETGDALRQSWELIDSYSCRGRCLPRTRHDGERLARFTDNELRGIIPGTGHNSGILGTQY